MYSTTVTFEGNLADTPQVRYTPSGKQIVEFTALVNRRRQNDAGEWIDEEPTRHHCKAFKQLAENIAESLDKGDRVLVTGTITTDAWTDRDTGQKRTRPTVLVDAIGPSLRWATARPAKTTRTPDTAEADHWKTAG